MIVSGCTDVPAPTSAAASAVAGRRLVVCQWLYSSASAYPPDVQRAIPETTVLRKKGMAAPPPIAAEAACWSSLFGCDEPARPQTLSSFVSANPACPQAPHSEMSPAVGA